MTQPIQIKAATPTDHDQWLALWLAYLHFYKTELPADVSQSTWQRFLDPNEPTHLALAWQGDKAVGMTARTGAPQTLATFKTCLSAPKYAAQVSGAC